MSRQRMFGTSVRREAPIYQFESGGLYNQDQLTLNYNIKPAGISLFGFYTLGFAKADTSGGATYIPSNQIEPGADCGRGQTTSQRFMALRDAGVEALSRQLSEG